ncbi:MAG: 8-amino-7-oxononanoate synthase [Mariprofundaceae bacterium]
MAESMPNMLDSRNWLVPPTEHCRRMLPATRRQGMHISKEHQQWVNFSSNDYLGLTTDTRMCQAANDANSQFGVGSGASRLISGDSPQLHTLEKKLAIWKGYEAALVVGSGMLANIGLIQTLANRHTHTFADRLNHASLVDGTRLALAKNHRYPHRDIKTLEGLLQRHTAERRIIVSDGVFSMDGDIADVCAMIALAEAYDTLLIIDDAHGTGTFGADGRGVIQQHHLQGHARLIEVGTFGKAFGGYGAFILGTEELIEGLRQSMRTLIYSTAIPPAATATALQALEIIRQGDRVQALHKNIQRFRARTETLPMLASETAIQPLMTYDDQATLSAANALRAQGFFVAAIRPPTVPTGQSRLRITLSSDHTLEQIKQLCVALHQLVP